MICEVPLGGRSPNYKSIDATCTPDVPCGYTIDWLNIKTEQFLSVPLCHWASCDSYSLLPSVRIMLSAASQIDVRAVDNAHMSIQEMAKVG